MKHSGLERYFFFIFDGRMEGGTYRILKHFAPLQKSIPSFTTLSQFLESINFQELSCRISFTATFRFHE